MTQERGVERNAHETIIPYYIFKQLELSAILRSLLPGKARR